MNPPATKKHVATHVQQFSAWSPAVPYTLFLENIEGVFGNCTHVAFNQFENVFQYLQWVQKSLVIYIINFTKNIIHTNTCLCFYSPVNRPDHVVGARSLRELWQLYRLINRQKWDRWDCHHFIYWLLHLLNVRLQSNEYYDSNIYQQMVSIYVYTW